jgi:hypothetical protein
MIIDLFHQQVADLIVGKQFFIFFQQRIDLFVGSNQVVKKVVQKSLVIQFTVYGQVIGIVLQFPLQLKKMTMCQQTIQVTVACRPQGSTG